MRTRKTFNTQNINNNCYISREGFVIPYAAASTETQTEKTSEKEDNNDEE